MKLLSLNILFLFCSSFLVAQTVDIYKRPVQHEPSHNFDVLHYRIKLTFEAKQKAFEGNTTISLRSLSDDLYSFSLDAESYEVKAVKSMEGAALTFSHLNGKLDISLSAPIDYGDTLSVVVTYGTNEFQVDPTQFGMGANYPLGLGFFEANEDHPFLFNSYSFPTGARHWFPCYDHPNDRATHETIITTQGDHKVLANGLLESVTKNTNGTVTFHWKQNQAHPTYLYNFVSGPYVIVEDQFKDIEVNYWVYPSDEEKGRRSFHRTPEVLAFFEEYYGVDYPWDKFDQIIVPGIGGGAEATTATLIGASTLHDEKAEKDFPSHWLVGHEAAHHWWGDFISYRDWTETWMSESFATFSEYLYSAHLYGAEEGALNIWNKRETYLNEAKNNYQRPIVFNQWEFPNQNFDRHTYQKGAVVLNMLRDYLGEEMFRRVLKHFLNTHAYEPVGTHDFIKSIWEVTGQNMDWFFDQWIFGAGHPILEIDYEWKNKQVILKVNQVQDTSHNVSIFKMPVDVSITTNLGTETKTIWLKEKENTFHFDVEQQPLLVDFDPENILLKEWTFKKSQKELLFQTQQGKLLSRMWAIRQLAEYNESEEVKKTLKTIAATADFWAIRKEALVSLTRKESKSLIPFLQQKLQDKHSRVRAEAIKLLGNTKQKHLQQLYRSTFEKDNSYVVQAEAIKALGKLKMVKDKALFEKVSKMKSPRNILQQAARSALKELKD